MSYPPQSYPSQDYPEQYPDQQGIVAPPPYTNGNVQPAMGVGPNGEPITTEPQPNVLFSRPHQQVSNKAIVGLVLSITALVCCGGYIVLLACLLPALILAIMAMANPGDANASTHATVSIVLTVVSVLGGVALLAVILGTAIGVPAYYATRTVSRTLAYSYRYRYSY